MCAAVLGFCAVPISAQVTFGRAVVVADGEVIVGEPASGNAFRPGAVYVYRKAGTAWRQAAKLTAPNAERADGFGAALALSGRTLFIAQTASPGGRGPAEPAATQIHVFARQPNGSWRAAGTISADIESALPPALAAAGDWLMVGSPGQFAAGRGRGGGRGAQAAAPAQPGSVLVFRRGSNGAWTQQTKLNAADANGADGFGAALAVGDGFALIGAPAKDERAGAVYHFRYESGSNSWQQAGVIVPQEAPGPRGGGAGNAATPQTQQTQPSEGFGGGIALSGNLALIGAPGAAANYGAAYLFRRDPQTGDWTQNSRLVAFNGGRQEGFGGGGAWARPMAIDGNEIWIGAPGRLERSGGAMRRPGGAYIYQFAEGANATADSRFIRPRNITPDDQFGAPIALAGGTAAVASPGADHNAGRVTVFERAPGGQWRETASLASEPDALPALTGQERKCSTEGKVGVFACGDAELLSYLPVSKIAINPRGVRLNDMWGWTDSQTGREFALVGRIEGTAFVDVTDPSNPIFVGELPKTPGVPDGTWRDIKVYKNHAYIVADGSGAHGMQVFDLTQLRGLKGTPPVSFKPTAHYTRINSSHNIVINEEAGFAYAVGASAGGETCGGGLHMIDIREPTKPMFAGCFADPLTGRAATGYSHDAQCVIYKGPDEQYRGREICLGSNENALSIADVTDKANPKAISRAKYPNPAYTHQGWLTEDHKYFYMDDESDEIAGTVDRTRTMVWDLTDLDDPQLATEFMGTSGASDHNLYIKGNLMYQSNYRAGLRIIDITDPVKPVEVGYFDTAPFLADAPGFSGTWSNYPYFKSGAIGVTSVHEGLFLVKKRDKTVF